MQLIDQIILTLVLFITPSIITIRSGMFRDDIAWWLAGITFIGCIILILTLLFKIWI